MGFKALFKSNLIVLSVFILVTWVPNSASAGLAEKCSLIFKSITSIFFKSKQYIPRPVVFLPTVEVQVLPEGGYKFTRKAGQRWYSAYSENIDDVQGSPKNFIEIVGDKFASTLGYKNHEELEINVPSFKKANSILGSLNENHIFSKIPFEVRFYEADGITLGKEYLSRFAQKAELPISNKGITVVHDYSYHFAYLLATPRLVTHLKNQIKLGLAFINFLETQALTGKESILLEDIEQVAKAYAIHLDSATGNFGGYYNRAVNERDEQWGNYNLTALNLLFKITPQTPELNKLKTKFAYDYQIVGWALEPLSTTEATQEVLTRYEQIQKLISHQGH